MLQQRTFTGRGSWTLRSFIMTQPEAKEGDASLLKELVDATLTKKTTTIWQSISLATEATSTKIAVNGKKAATVSI